MHPRARNLALITSALLALGLTPAAAGPAGGTVVGGSATIQGAGTGSVTVNQSSQRAIINWNTFNIGTGETTRFNQPNSSAIVLNRVTGGLGASEILGTLTANGRVFVINRDGILFGPGAVVNTAGFLATTHDIKNDDFMAGRMNFNIPGRPDASIVNQGRITATSGGFAALVAPGVRNSGTITATLGTVALAAGNSFTLDLYGDRLITLAVNDQIAATVTDVATGKPLKSLVTNDGRIRANGGRVELTAAAARTVVDSVINTSGVIKANSIGTRNGMIVLSAATGASKPAGAPAQVVRISGTLSAVGKKKDTSGGTILVTGEHIKVANAKIDASGRSGGGKVLIGGDWGGGRPASGLVNNQSARLETFAIPTATTVSIDAGSTINASARDSGHGGKVVLWSDQQTTFSGTILARGGNDGGNGGFVETSGHERLNFTGTVDTRAPRGAAGTLLLDPRDIFIQASGAETITQSGTNFTSNVDFSVLTVATLQTALSMGNVIVQTGSSGTQSGDITVASDVNWSSGNSLTLLAHRNVQFNNFTTLTNTGGANVVLRADSQGTGVGTVTFGTSAGISTSGNVAIYFNPSVNPAGSPVNSTSYVSPVENFTGNVMGGGTLSAYMLVNTGNDLQNMQNNLTGSYALGNNITANLGHSPIGNSTPFSGILDGKNPATGQSYTISGLNVFSGGLFGTIGTNGNVRNLDLVGATITPYYTATVGALARINDGSVSFVNVSGTINGAGFWGVTAGGLVGRNNGQIANSSSSVNVTVGNGTTFSPTDINIAGGLVGQNTGTVTGSSSSGNVASGFNSFAGGLVGQSSGTITSSSSSSAVTGNSGNSPTDISSAIGGLVGFNTGLIAGSFATGPITGMGNTSFPSSAMIAGGLVGLNNPGGQIVNSQGFGNVTATGQFEIGGLVGGNFASISGSYATGAVTGIGSGIVGGLAGLNSGGTIANSYATGSVIGSTGNVSVGGLVGDNDSASSIVNSYATGAVSISASGAADQTAGGLVGANEGTITGSYATGPVGSFGGDVIIGGLVGGNIGNISNSFATGNVTATNAVTALAGGLAGLNFTGNIFQSFATGNVSVGGSFAIAGGLIGFNAGVAGNSGFLNQVFATGAVTGNATESLLAGLVGVNGNFGTILQAYATGPVTGNSGGAVAGLVAVNTGSIDQTYAIGQLTGGGVVGGLVAANSSAPFPALSGHNDLGPLVTGTGAVSSSYWDPQTTGVNASAGGTSRSTQDFIASLPPGFDPTVWGIQPDPSYPHFGWQPAGTVPIGPNGPTPPPDTVVLPTNIPPQTQIIQNLIGPDPTQLAALNTDPVATIIPPPTPPPTPPRGTGPGAGTGPAQTNPYLPPGFTQRIFDIPPLTETRFVKDEVLLQVATIVTMERLQDAVRSLGLTLIESQSLGTTGSIAVRFRITNGQTVQDIIRQLQSIEIIAVGQPMYLYALAQQPEPAPASRGGPAQADPAQYIVQKWRLPDVHQLVKGANVKIAVIDSEIDAGHPDLRGVIIQRFSAVGAPEKPHAHGTGMAGAIASHQRVVGTAPGARLLAVHAFSTAANAESTTYQILKGLDWAVFQGVRIINMSFAGPKDPSLERSLKSAYDKGIVLIAAAGNAGPKSPPLFPGADPNVIAVTATDADDKLFAGANRGKYISVAAPGVDILVPAPDGAYQLTTGTSVAAAEVSGIVALLLEHNPALKPADVRRILTASAKRLGPGERDDDFGWGLVDPTKAIQSAAPRSATTTPVRQR